MVESSNFSTSETRNALQVSLLPKKGFHTYCTSIEIHISKEEEIHVLVLIIKQVRAEWQQHLRSMNIIQLSPEGEVKRGGYSKTRSVEVYV